MFTATGMRPRMRRSRLVCISCHQKKIKCDLQANPSAPCSKCVDSGDECHVRPSRRSKAARHGAQQAQNSQSAMYSNCDGSLPLETTAFAAQGPLTPMLSSLGSHQSNQPQTLASQSPRRSIHVQLPNNTQLQTSSQAPVVNNASPLEPSPGSSARDGTNVPSYLGTSGFMRIFQKENQAQDTSDNAPDISAPLTADLPPSALQDSYFQTYLKHCYTWCPVIDTDGFGSTEITSESPLLQYSLAVVGSLIEPPVAQHKQPVVYYRRAKGLFYSDAEKNSLVAISAIMLFYWWGFAPPHLITMDSSWWWTGCAIRQAQQLGLHREAIHTQSFLPGETPGIRRRIWWTLFARERLTSLCTGRPTVIHPDDCNVAEPSLDDFPPHERARAEIFIHWVKLCAIIGRVKSYRSQKTEATPFPTHLAQELKEWTHSLPEHLQLPIEGQRTSRFNSDIYQLHIPYLVTVTLLHLSGSSDLLPTAYTTAVLASCCMARIFEDLTARSSLRFLQGISGWGISIAILALLHARKVHRLRVTADAHIRVLRVSLREMAKLWYSSRLFDREFDRIELSSGDTPPFSMTCEHTINYAPDHQSPLPGLSDHGDGGDSDWKGFFPYLTPQTSPLAAILLDPIPSTPFADIEWPADLSTYLQSFFGPGPLEEFGSFGFTE